MQSIDPNDIEALKRRIAELEAAQAGTVTQGGAAIAGGVDTAGGNFIGRDFVQHLTQIFHNGDDPAEVQAAIAHYLRVLVKDLAGLKLGEIDAGIDQTRQKPLQLADIYVPLNTTLRIPQKQALADWLKRKKDRGERAVEDITRPVSALEALAQHRELAVLGKPGSGKSTFGASVLMALAQAWQGHDGELAKLGDTWKHGRLLPIRVVLRRFAESLPAGEVPARAGDLWRFIRGDLEAGLSAKTADYVQRIAEQEGALILLDGLDECGSAERRARVVAAVTEFKTNAGEKCRFLLTARPYAWPDGADAARGVYRLDELDEEQIERFIHAWYDALVKREWRTAAEAAPLRDDLLMACGRLDLLALAKNPLLLTLMATLHSNRGHLPDDRADLYDESVNLLIGHWNRKVGAEKALLDALGQPAPKLSDLRGTLERLAFETHERNVGNEGAADIGEDRLVRAFKSLFGGDKNKADIVVDYIEKRAGLLLWQSEIDDENRYAFPHRTFQEFLAACHLAKMDKFGETCVELARAAPWHWQEVLPLAARLAGVERGTHAADGLIGGVAVAEFQSRAKRAPDAADWTCALLAGLQLKEIGLLAVGATPCGPVVVGRVTGWLAASLPVYPSDGGAPAPSRARAGDVLAALGDPRFDAARYFLPADDDLGFVAIAADPAFMIGTRKANKKRVKMTFGFEGYDDEINDAPTPTPAFHIARYPVTVAQFRAYCAASGVAPDDANALRDADSRPVRFVSWTEALGYCEWLQRVLATSPALAASPVARRVREDGWCVALPSELEWEKAARGGLAAAIFPWGNEPDPERANYDATEIGDTAAVGCFPANGYGLCDMVGNVWEWTRSRWKDTYPYDGAFETADSNNDKGMVVRGGSWGYLHDLARCAFRFRLPPGFRLDYIGFRLVLRSSPAFRL